MNRWRGFLALLVLLCLATPAGGMDEFAPALSIGGVKRFSHTPSLAADHHAAPVWTSIHTLFPSTGTGYVSGVELYWVGANCDRAATIKFFRPEGDRLRLIDQRGPFNFTESSKCSRTSPSHCIQFDIPVDVVEGDLIGVTRLAACGSPGVEMGDPQPPAGSGFLQYAGDISGTVAISDGTVHSGYLGMTGHGRVTEYTAAVVPVVASTVGAFGSTWKTSVEIVNRHASKEITGKLILRRSGTGSVVAPEIAFTVAPARTLSLADVMAMFGATGLASLDVFVTSGPLPHVSSRILHDGDAGTESAFVEAVNPAASEVWCWDAPSYPGTPVLGPGVAGFLLTPESPADARFNLGVRALSGGAAIVATLRDRDGSARHSTTRSYGPHQFEQVSAEQFLGIPIAGSESIRLEVVEGLAIIYGVATDNATNDPSLQRVEGVLYTASEASMLGAGARAPQATREIERILPIIGPPDGSGSDWRTEVQLFNPHSSIVTGRIQFHRTGAAATADAPAIEYTLVPGQILTYPDIVDAAGASGHGYLTFGYEWKGFRRPAPVIVARAYGGSYGTGTQGTMIDAVDPNTWWGCGLPSGEWFAHPTLEPAESGSLKVAGPDERLTIGIVGTPTHNVRGPISFSATLLHADGRPLTTVSRTYAETWSEEIRAEDLFGMPLAGGQSIRIDGQGGALLIYAVTTDTRTGDVRIQYLSPQHPSSVAVIP